MAIAGLGEGLIGYRAKALGVSSAGSGTDGSRIGVFEQEGRS
jgi:hypothetical protein